MWTVAFDVCEVVNNGLYSCLWTRGCEPLHFNVALQQSLLAGLWVASKTKALSWQLASPLTLSHRPKNPRVRSNSGDPFCEAPRAAMDLLLQQRRGMSHSLAPRGVSHNRGVELNERKWPTRGADLLVPTWHTCPTPNTVEPSKWAGAGIPLIVHL